MAFGKRGAAHTAHSKIPSAPVLEATREAPSPSPTDTDASSYSEEDAVLGNAYIGQSVVALHIMDARDRILEDQEVLLGAFHGSSFAREEYGMSAQRKGGFALHDYLLVTDRRVITWARGMFKQSVDAFHYNDIASVEATKGLILGEIVINVRGAKERFGNMVTADTPIAERLIRDNISKQRSPSPASAAEGKPSLQSMFDSLERLSVLKDKGLITEAEFAAKRQKIVDGI